MYVKVAIQNSNSNEGGQHDPSMHVRDNNLEGEGSSNKGSHPVPLDQLCNATPKNSLVGSSFNIQGLKPKALSGVVREVRNH